MAVTSQLPRALGWASLGLGVPMVAAPRVLLRAIGVRPSDAAHAWTLAVGGRELAAALGLLVLHRERPAPWVWARVAGDAKDLVLLARARQDDPRRTRAAIGAVAGIAAADVATGVLLARAPHPTEDEPVQVKAYVTTIKSREEVEAAWMRSGEVAELEGLGRVQVAYATAPGDLGTEIRVTLDAKVPGGPLGAAVKKVTGKDPRQQAFDHLRRFKQELETGVIARSDGTPIGHSATTQPKQRPAQPVESTPAS
jgi:hypothetical protein